MSTANETVTGIDWELLEDSLEAPACEFQQHGKHFSHPDNGPAEFYFRGHCPKCEATGPLLALCKDFADRIRLNPPMTCSVCRQVVPALESTLLLEPIKP